MTRSLRLLHTSDWHLGRVLHGRSLLTDQEFVLEKLVGVVADVRPDALLVAGDVFDRTVPPVEAVRLLDDVLERIVLGHGVPVVMIAGNHDCGRRLGFGSRLLTHKGLYVTGTLAQGPRVLTLPDAHGSVAVYALPYAEPATVREHMGLSPEEARTHDACMSRLVQGILARHDASERSVLIAHCFVNGGNESESERPLSIGGTSAVNPSVFEAFDYVGLGHLHRPQTVGQSGKIRYSGSLLQYSFSEVDHAKSVELVELGAPGKSLHREAVSLESRRKLRRVEGTLAQVLEESATDGSRGDYLVVNLQDEGLLFDAIGKLREVYPNVLHIERPRILGSTAEARSRTDSGASRRPPQRPLDLVAAHFRETRGEDMTDAMAARAARLLADFVE